MIIKTSELEGLSLDYAVAVAEGHQDIRLHQDMSGKFQVLCRRRDVDANGSPLYLLDFDTVWSPSTLWSQGGEIIQKQHISLLNDEPPDRGVMWIADIGGWMCDDFQLGETQETGPTHLIAAMRCYVASKFGDQIEFVKDGDRFALNGSTG